MQRLMVNLWQASQRKLFTLGIVLFIAFSLLVFFSSAPSYAATFAEQKLTPPSEKPTSVEKIDRAYEYSEATGLLEQAKQDSANARKLTNPNTRANMETVTNPKAEESAQNLGEKAKQILEKVTGKEQS